MLSLRLAKRALVDRADDHNNKGWERFLKVVVFGHWIPAASDPLLIVLDYEEVLAIVFGLRKASLGEYFSTKLRTLQDTQTVI